MEHLIWTPLTEKEIETLAQMQVGLWSNFATKQTYINKGWWRYASPAKQMAVARVLETMRGERHE
jgi:hypothetical protein